MSDEKRQAIDLLKNIDNQKCMMLECPVVKNNIERQLKIIELNRTIRKQSKEIEELKEKNEYLPNWVSKKYVSKDKIKAKIKEIDEKLEYETNGWESEYEYCKEVLQSLLEKE